MTQTVEERLLTNSHEEDRGYETLCRVWEKSLTNRGYGQVKVDGRMWATHRLSYVMWVGPIPTGMQVNHHCDQRDCFNPEHLYAGTQKQNVQDAIDRQRGHVSRGWRSELTHCKHGHEFTEENTYVRTRGRGRDCRECRRAWSREFQARAKAAQ